MLGALQNLAYTAVLLGVLVTIHEFGHFLVAKAMGVKVVRFSFGFGPRLLGFTRGETEYRLSALFLGGYVKMAGDIPGEELPPEEAARGFLNQKPWKRALISFAGPAFSLGFPIFLYLLVFSAFPQLSTRVGAVTPGLPAARAQLQAGDRIRSVNGHRTEAWIQVQHEIERSAGQNMTVVVEREGGPLTLQVVPAQLVNEVPVRGSTRGVIGIASLPEPPVVGVRGQSAAFQAGLRTGDRVMSVDGTAVLDLPALQRAVAASRTGAPLQLTVARFEDANLPGAGAVIPALVHLQVSHAAGASLGDLGVLPPELFISQVVPDSAAAKLGLVPGDFLKSLNGQALPSFTVLQLVLQNAGERPFTLSWEHDGVERSAETHQSWVQPKGRRKPVLMFGVAPTVAVHLSNLAIDKSRVSFGAAVSMAMFTVANVAQESVGSLVLLVRGTISTDSITSVIGIHEATSRAAKAGMESYLQLMAIISISLGIMNLLPIPILDGFQLVAAAWEAVRRREMPARAREIANYVGLAILVLLMVVAFTNDIKRSF